MGSCSVNDLELSGKGKGSVKFPCELPPRLELELAAFDENDKRARAGAAESTKVQDARCMLSVRVSLADSDMMRR